MPATEPATSTNPSSGTYVSAAEHGNNTSKDVESNRSSRAGSDHGPATGIGTSNNNRGQSLGHNHMLENITPTSVLKSHLPESPYSPQVSNLEKLLNFVQGDAVGFNLLREMELLEEDDLMDFEGSVDL